METTDLRQGLADRLGLTQLSLEFPHRERDCFGSAVRRGIDNYLAHGNARDWLHLIAALGTCSGAVDLDTEIPSCPLAADEDFTEQLLQLRPWRKGPFRIGRTLIDSEWNSALKWKRLLDHMGRLEGRRILDIGTGNGYFLLRALGAGAERVLGLEPSALSVAQYLAVQQFFNQARCAMLPLPIEELGARLAGFDLVLSMGVLYHRRSPLDHLFQLRDLAEPGGTVVVETTIVDGPEGYSLLPESRYANMRNVWFIPSVDTLVAWCRRVGLRDIEVGQVVKTTHEEQRATAFSGMYSLKNALDVEQPELTVEGYPAPKRVIVSGVV